jgi:hypothetical protein
MNAFLGHMAKELEGREILLVMDLSLLAQIKGFEYPKEY